MIEQSSRRRAFEEVVAEHLDALYRTAVRYTRGDPACAEDLLQDTLLAALAAWPQLREPQRARVWLLRILSRMHLNRMRHAARHPELASLQVDEDELEQALAAWSPGPDPESLALGEAGLQRVVTALDTLPEDWSQVFWLVDVEGFSYHEAAQLLDVAAGTIASRLHRARAALRDCLSAQGGERNAGRTR